MTTPYQTRTMKALGRAYFRAIQDELGREEFPEIEPADDLPAARCNVLVMPKRERR